MHRPDLPNYVSLNGVVVPYADAKVHVQTPLVRYGAGVFEGICAYWNPDEEDLLLFRLEDHLIRLYDSMRIMRFDDMLTLDQMRRSIVDLLLANQFRIDLHIRIIVWIDEAGEQFATGPLGWSVMATPRSRASASLPLLHCGVSSWERISDTAMPPRVKSVANYSNGRLSWMQAKLDGYDIALLLTKDGQVSESLASCLFMVRNGAVVTPRITGSILESITRATVIQLLGEMGLVTQERGIDRTELYIAQEAFLYGSGQEIAALASIDRYTIKTESAGPLTSALAARYFDVVRGKTSAHAAWRSAVYRGALVTGAVEAPLNRKLEPATRLRHRRRGTPLAQTTERRPHFGDG